jgi:hypothetical protein
MNTDNLSLIDKFVFVIMPLNKTDTGLLEFGKLYNFDNSKLEEHFINERRYYKYIVVCYFGLLAAVMISSII